MKADEWQQMNDLFHAALEREPGERAAFLAQACAGDEGLRLEVESLLASHDPSDNFIESLAPDLAAGLLAEGQARLATGQSVGNYRVMALLGVGGMGEVYLTEDTRLGRRVALKLLPAQFTTEPDRLHRFEREARAASSLNHPNIITIHEVGQLEGEPFIITEFIEGKTLRQQMAAATMMLREALDVAIQVASALAAAHEAGIVHRDIKPENVMVRRDGLVKVLDFGLAKLAMPQLSALEEEAQTRSMVNTNPGVVIGTVQYMSPEQARGQEVDVRTDIWTLGVVLYEMVAGRAPFQGETPSHVIVSVLESEPPPLAGYSEVPVELERIVTKALRKDREERYQTASDLAIDLKNLKQQLDVDARLQRSLDPDSSSRETATKSAGQTTPNTGHASAARTADVGTARPTSSATDLVSEIKRHKLGAFVSLAVLLGVTGVLAYRIYRVAPHVSQPHFQKVKFTRLTTIGNATNAAVSPDGKFIAYVQFENGKYSFWTKAVATGNAVQIVQPAEARKMSYTTFSPDGNYVYYTVEENNGPGVLYQIPVLGGTPKKMLTKVATPIAFSPDGGQFAFVSRTHDYGESHLVVVNTDGSGERILSRRSANELFSDGGPSWSPDGKIIAIGGSSVDRSGHWTVMGVAVESGEVRPLSQQTWSFVDGVEWFRDGSGLVLATRDRFEDKRQIWQLSYPGGEARRITNDLNSYASVSLTADSGALVTTQSQRSSNLWVAPNGDADRARQLTSRSNADEGFLGMSWTPDGRIVYSSTAAVNHSNLWIMNGDGSNPTQLTDSPADDLLPSVSPDGRYIVFTSNRSGVANLWRIDMDGGNPKQLTNGMAWAADFSPDGRWVACIFQQSGKLTLWKITIEGDSAVQLTDTFANAPAVSSDGKLIAYYYYEQAEKKTKVVIIPSEGGSPVKVLDYAPGTSPSLGVQWSPDDGSLIYVDERQGGANLWRLPLDGSPARQVTNFKSEKIWNFQFTRDGRQLVCARGTTTGDVVMISETK
jgi:serine/threonine protein kinase/Tol biopolymer transport system component